jgi:hypothetical protein
MNTWDTALRDPIFDQKMDSLRSREEDLIKKISAFTNPSALRDPIFDQKMDSLRSKEEDLIKKIAAFTNPSQNFLSKIRSQEVPSPMQEAQYLVGDSPIVVNDLQTKDSWKGNRVVFVEQDSDLTNELKKFNEKVEDNLRSKSTRTQVRKYVNEAFNLELSSFSVDGVETLEPYMPVAEILLHHVKRKVLANLPIEFQNVRNEDIYVYNSNFRDTKTEGEEGLHGGSFQAIHADAKDFDSMESYLNSLYLERGTLGFDRQIIPGLNELLEKENDGDAEILGLNYWMLIEDEGNHYPLAFLDRTSLGENIDPFGFEQLDNSPRKYDDFKNQFNPAEPNSVRFLTKKNMKPGEGFLFQTFGEDHTIHTAVSKEKKTEQAGRKSLEFRILINVSGK